MKTVVTIFALTFSFFAHSAPIVGQVFVDGHLTERLINILSGLDVVYSGGEVNGVKIYGAQLECTNASGDLDPQSMRCFIRPLVGFSLSLNSSLELTGVLATDLKVVLLESSMSYAIGDGLKGLGAKVSCEDKSGVGDIALPNVCKLNRAF